MAYFRFREIVLPEIVLERPEVQALQTADGKNNYTLARDSGSVGAAAKIANLRVSDGQAHVVIPTLKADFELRIATRNAPAASGTALPESQIVVNAKGTYAGQPSPASSSAARFFRCATRDALTRLTSSSSTAPRTSAWPVR